MTRSGRESTHLAVCVADVVKINADDTVPVKRKQQNVIVLFETFQIFDKMFI